MCLIPVGQLGTEGMGLLNLKGQDSAWEPLTIARAGSETVWTQFAWDLEVVA